MVLYLAEEKLQSEERRQIQNLARDVARKELAPKAAELDRISAFPNDSLKKLAEVYKPRCTMGFV